ncbi:MAG: hypothetical protein H6953_08470 [Chromatiaceae bacterium]|nr:hypothetical protein [Chromatiaceae bacterium]MCP5315427.1 hypothetical protein [Chromatiaceae bacterium]
MSDGVTQIKSAIAYLTIFCTALAQIYVVQARALSATHPVVTPTHEKEASGDTAGTVARRGVLDPVDVPIGYPRQDVTEARCDHYADTPTDLFFFDLPGRPAVPADRPGRDAPVTA